MKKTINFLIKLLIVVIIIGLGIAFLMYMVKTKPKTTPKETAIKSWLIDAQPVSFDSISPQVKLYGRVVSHSEMIFTAPLSAQISYLTAKPGQVVDKGELLVKLNADEVEFAVKTSRADIENIKASIRLQNSTHKDLLKQADIQRQILSIKNNDYDRLEKLHKKNLASQADMEFAKEAQIRQQLTLNTVSKSILQHQDRLKQYQTQLEKAVINLKKAQLNRGRAIIKAPATGVVSKVNANAGLLVNNGQSLLNFYSLNSLEVEVKLPERVKRQMLRIPSGIEARLTPNAETLVWDRFAPSSNGVSTKGYFRFKELPFNYRIGDSVSLIASFPKVHGVLAVPYSALYDENTIYVVREEKLLSVRVQRLGNIYQGGDVLAILQGGDLRETDEIMLTHLSNAVSGLPVKIAR